MICDSCKYQNANSPMCDKQHIPLSLEFDGKCKDYEKSDMGIVKIEMPYIDFLLMIEQALRNNIVVWEDEEYRDIAERISENVKCRSS